jgi:magnesium transporter
MIGYLVHQGGATREEGRLDPGWLASGSGVLVWADVQAPDEADAQVLRESFGFHELAIEDALQDTHHPKVESYQAYLYLVLHGINFSADEHHFDTHDTDFFLGSNYLVTVHNGLRRRSLQHVRDLCARSPRIMAEGPVALLHRIIDTMADHYRPEVDALEDRIDALEDLVLEAPGGSLMGDILAIKRDVAALRRIVIPQRDVVARLARREFDQINQEMAYRFRDVYDQFVRMSDDAMIYQDRITGILDAHLATVSNQLAQVSKLLAVVAALFGPLTVITGVYGMNVELPVLPGGERMQFWWVIAWMAASSGLMFALFRRMRWL